MELVPSCIADHREADRDDRITAKSSSVNREPCADSERSTPGPVSPEPQAARSAEIRWACA